MSERGRRWLYSIVTVDLGWARGRDWRGDEHWLIVDLGYGDFDWDRVKHCDWRRCDRLWLWGQQLFSDRLLGSRRFDQWRCRSEMSAQTLLKEIRLRIDKCEDIKRFKWFRHRFHLDGMNAKARIVVGTERTAALICEARRLALGRKAIGRRPLGWQLRVQS